MKNYIYKNYRIYHFDELKSTNLKAQDLALNNQIHDKSIIICDRQTAGRGRKDRVWDSEIGNLFFSIFLKTEFFDKKSDDLGENLKKIQQISLILAICVQKTIKNFVLGSKSDEILVQNKWPNDILINNQKISGILLESQIKDKKCEFVIGGIGVNLVSNPKNTNFLASNLSKFDINVSKTEFLEKFIDIFEEFYQKWQDFGFLWLKNVWLENAWKINEEIQIKLENEIKSGVFNGLDENGNLLLKTAKGLETITFGDVS